jgi:integrase
MSTRIKPLTVKFIEHVSKPGDYPDGQQLYLRVADDRKSKSWVQFFNRTKLGKKGKGELGLGSYPEVSLAAAREARGEVRKLVAQGIDPVEHKKNEQQKRWLANATNLGFLAVGENFITMKSRGERPWWCEERTQSMRNILYNKFKPLHAMPINSAEAADMITLKLYEIIGPKWLTTPAMATTMKHLAYGIGKRAHGLKVLPMNVANPAGEPLDALLTERQPEAGHWLAVPYRQTPVLYSKLDEFSQSRQSYFTATEAARAIGEPIQFITKRIRSGELPATKGEATLPAQVKAGIIPYEWRIEPAELFKRWDMIVDVIPGVPPVIFDLIKFCALNGPRPSEARKMQWDQYNEDERLWIIPWQKTKEGQDIRQDMAIPLSDPANDIVVRMKDIQRRYRMQTKYVFANYPSRFNTNARIGEPPCNVAALENLRKTLRNALSLDQVKATMHGFRTNIRSWGEDQRWPNGSRRFDEKDLERALGHIAGFGKTKVARDYSRQSSDIIPLIPIFDGWGKYVTSGGKPSDVIYDDRFIRKAAGG